MALTRRQLRDAFAIAERFVRYQALKTSTPAVSYGLADDGDIVLAGARGLADLASGEAASTKTGYRVASITKTFTATVVMQLVEQGRIRLDERVVTYLPWLQPALGRSEVTVRHLLTHSAGMISDGSCAWEDDDFPDRDALHRDVLEQIVVTDPSVGFLYSSVAYALLGEIIEQADGRQFATALDRRVVRPLGLDATGTRITPKTSARLATGYYWRRPDEPYVPARRSESRAFEPAGGLISNIVDLLSYQRAHLPGDNRLVTELTKREMQRVQWQRSEEPHHGYGWMIWTVDGIGLCGHNGGYVGFNTRIAFSRDLGLVAAVLTNTIGPLAFVAIDAIFHVIARVREVWDDAYETAHGYTRASLARFEGQYRGSFGEILVARVNNALYLLDPDDERPMRHAARLVPIDQRARFRIVDHEDYGHRGETVSFAPANRGKAATFRYGVNELLRADP